MGDATGTIILGAGPAGMACAIKLFNAGKKFILIDKENKVGGLSSTYKFGKFRTDNGPHRFFSQNKYLYDFIKDLIKEKWIIVNRSTKFYVNGKFYKYPIEWTDTLTKLGLIKAFSFIFDYIIQRFKSTKGNFQNFEKYAVSSFGKSLADFNILNYTEKIWGLPTSKISVDWADQRIADLSLKSVLINTFLKSKSPKSLINQFYYPSLGTGLIYDTIKEKISKRCKVMLNNYPTRINHKNYQIKSLILNSKNKLTVETVISSIPITQFIELLSPAAPSNVLNACKKLKYRSQVYLFLTINKPNITKDQWIYFPDKEIPFGRISEMKNFSKLMSPKEQTSLFIEFFCWEGDNLWNMTKNDLYNLTIKWLEKLKLLNREEVLKIYHLRQVNAYPVYDLSYTKNLKVIKKYLNGFKNLYYIGRQGRFKYTNQDHSLEMGFMAAKSILENKYYDIDLIGSDPSFLERGSIE